MIGVTGERGSFVFSYQSNFFVSFNSTSDLNNLKIKEFVARVKRIPLRPPWVAFCYVMYKTYLLKIV